MADKDWQAGGGIMIPAGVVVCLIASVWAITASDLGAGFVGYLSAADPDVVSDVVLGGLVTCCFLIAVWFWVMSTLRRFRLSQQRRNVFVSSALNNLKQGMVITNPRQRIVFLNDRYLEIYGLARSDITPDMTGRGLLELRLKRGVLDVSADEFYAQAALPDGLITELPNGQSVHVKHFPLSNGGSITTHEDCSEQRELSRQLASTKQFLESVLENVPVCVAAKNIDDGRYIFANRAFERFSRFSRDFIVGKRADEIFTPETAASIVAADRAALNSTGGQFSNEFVVERGSKRRVLASNRVIARNEKNEPQFLVALFDDVTKRRVLSEELEKTKKFLEQVVDNVPVSLTVEDASNGRYLLANRSAEAILNRRREEVAGLTAAEIFNEREARLIVARDEAAIRNRKSLTE